jgi:lysozyme
MPISAEGLAILKRQEGYRQFMYKDSLGINTIAYGLNLDAGIDEELASVIAEFIANRLDSKLTLEFDWYKQLTQRRKDVLINMSYNLGVEGVKEFKNTISLIERSKFDEAADAMLKSKWATQVGLRAKTLSDMMRRG